MKVWILRLALISALTVTAGFAQTEIVRRAQQVLQDQGYDPGALDGVMGGKTRSAIRRFQRRHSLKPDGLLGHQTLVTLGVEDADAGTHFKSAGSNITNSYAAGGKEFGAGGKDFGSDIRDGNLVDGAKDFGKNVGEGAAQIGVGTGRAAKNVAKGVKDAMTHDKSKKRPKTDH